MPLVWLLLGVAVGITFLCSGLVGRWWGGLIPWAVFLMWYMAREGLAGSLEFAKILSLPVLPIVLVLRVAGTEAETGQLKLEARAAVLILGVVTLLILPVVWSLAE